MNGVVRVIRPQRLSLGFFTQMELTLRLRTRKAVERPRALHMSSPDSRHAH